MGKHLQHAIWDTVLQIRPSVWLWH